METSLYVRHEMLHGKAAYRHRQAQHGLSQIPVVQGEGYTVYQGDARAIAPALQGMDAVIADPPYGTAYDFTKPRRSTCPLQGVPAARWAANIPGDDRRFDPTPWLGYPQVILWGAQHFASRLPDSPAWLIWDKRDGSTPDDHSDCEMAWTNLPGVSRIHRQLWRGIIRAGEENVVHGGKLHPGQKPLALMRWCVAHDWHGARSVYGSGTTGIACLELGRPFIGIELDPHYFAVACQRLETACAQGTLFPAPPRPP